MGITIAQLGVHLTIFVIVLFSSSLSPAQEGTETVAQAAQKAFDQGAKELEQGNLTGAITLLKTAVRIQPENGQFQHQLAKAYLESKQYHEMWIHLRKAATLDLGNEDFAQDFLRMWRYHDLQGTLNVGTVDNEVLKALGQPDKRLENGQMKRWIYGFMAVDFGMNQAGKPGVFRVIDLRGYTADAAREVEHVRVKTNREKWQIAHHHVSKTNDNLELTANGEKIQAWTELFSKQRFPLMSRTGASVKGMLESIQKSLVAVDPNVEFTVLSKSPSEAHYHWITRATKNNPAQHEIAKIIKGQKDFYRIAYVKKTERLSKQEFAKWSKVIGDATLVPMKDSSVTSAKENVATRAANTRFQSWELGKSLAFAALIRGKHGPDATVKSMLLTVSKNSQALKVTVPAPDKQTDDVNTDTAAAIEFLLNKAGKPIYKSLQENHGEDHSALFELAVKSTLLSMLYEPGDSTSEAFATAIRRSAKNASLDEAVWKALTDKVMKQADQAMVTSEIKQFQQRVAQAISK